MKLKKWHFVVVAFSSVLLLKIAVDKTYAHCDTMGGPVILEAKAALL